MVRLVGRCRDATPIPSSRPERARHASRRLVERPHERERPRSRRRWSAVPRHAFVPDAQRRGSAYADRPLPIGNGQTISAPHIVAIMCDILDPDSGDSILEIGTGCGYHAAVMAELGADIYTVEYHESLAQEARDRLHRLGYDVRVRHGDGREGWPAHAPYDGVYLTCAAPEIPDAILDQTRPGGQVVAPVGRAAQRLVGVTVGEGTAIRERTDHGGVRFVPLLGDD
ncbi:MAG: protein-L-isoaspartate(D-aspartate) O-methyltransferase [Halobacteriales archaeon]|nr:protein-L-isoaspartate(D-aspartate) O-methyltransferase [Halobacteriales archaeon]